MREWEQKLNVNVLLALCMCWNTHQAAWVLADYWCCVHVPRLWTANARRENSYAHAPFKNLHCAASILRQQTVQHKRIFTETQESESRGPDSSPRGERSAVGGGGQGGGPDPFKAKPTIMKLWYFLQEWRTHYPPFEQGPQDFSESITFVLMLQRIYIGVLCWHAATQFGASTAAGSVCTTAYWK